jgi:hypothetical protein
MPRPNAMPGRRAALHCINGAVELLLMFYESAVCALRQINHIDFSIGRQQA